MTNNVDIEDDSDISFGLLATILKYTFWVELTVCSQYHD